MSISELDRTYMPALIDSYETKRAALLDLAVNNAIAC